MKKAQDHIPDNILRAAARCGLTTPLWYVGRTKGHPSPNHKTLAQIADEVRREAR